MTENEAIKVLTDKNTDISTSKCDDVAWRRLQPAVNVAITALKEIQKYRALGTVEELREAREKQRVKTPYIWGDGYSDGYPVYDMYDCPNCGESYEIDGEKHDYCPNCGQSIDWST